MPKAAPKHRPGTPASKRHCPPQASRQARRTLATNSAAWQALRLDVLLRDIYTCQACKRLLGRRKGDAHVDHINNDPRNNDMDNLQTLCAPCHSSKTGKQDGGFGNRASNA